MVFLSFAIQHFSLAFFFSTRILQCLCSSTSLFVLLFWFHLLVWEYHKIKSHGKIQFYQERLTKNLWSQVGLSELIFLPVTKTEGNSSISNRKQIFKYSTHIKSWANVYWLQHLEQLRWCSGAGFDLRGGALQMCAEHNPRVLQSPEQPQPPSLCCSSWANLVLTDNWCSPLKGMGWEEVVI